MAATLSRGMTHVEVQEFLEADEKTVGLGAYLNDPSVDGNSLLDATKDAQVGGAIIATLSEHFDKDAPRGLID